MDPSGTFIRYDAKAIGSGSEGAQQALQEVYHKVPLSYHVYSPASLNHTSEKLIICNLDQVLSAICFHNVMSNIF